MKPTDKEQLLLDKERLERLRDEHHEYVVKERVRALDEIFTKSG